MNIGTILMLTLLGINLLVSAYLHGKPKTGENTFWPSLIGCGLWLSLMYLAGLL